jgi:hypothetical protein
VDQQSFFEIFRLVLLSATAGMAVYSWLKRRERPEAMLFAGMFLGLTGADALIVCGSVLMLAGLFLMARRGSSHRRLNEP